MRGLWREASSPILPGERATIVFWIWVMRADGTHKRLLGRHPSRILAHPRFSPDGNSILYTSFEAGEAVRGHRLHTARLNGSGRALIGAGTEGDW